MIKLVFINRFHCKVSPIIHYTQGYGQLVRFQLVTFQSPRPHQRTILAFYFLIPSQHFYLSLQYSNLILKTK